MSQRKLHAVPPLTEDFDLPEVPEMDPASWDVDLPESLEDAELLLDIEDGAVIPVDPPAPGGPGRRGVSEWLAAAQEMAEARPVLPEWLADPEQRRQAAAFVRRHVGHGIRFHGARTPVYAGRAVRRAPRGALRTVRGAHRWVFDAEARELRGAAVQRNDPKAYLALVKERNRRVRQRGYAVLAGGLVLLISLLVIAAAAPWWAQALTAIGALLVLAKLGTDADRPLVQAATVVPRARRLTADVVERAFVAAKLASEREPISFPAPIVRDGAGWRAVIDLPYSTTAEQALRKREQIAAGLDLDESMVWPERIRGTAGSARRLGLWVADEDPFAKPSGSWPLAQRGQCDLFRPAPFGQDQRGRDVPVQLMFTSVLVGAIPRMGKTYAARLLALAGALDLTCEQHIYDGKGGQDWRMFAGIAHRIGFGARDDVVLALLADLRDLREDMDRRYDQLAALPAELVPESKITRDVASRPGLGLHPVQVVIDEFQRFSEHREYGEEIVELLIDLAKVGPAVGIMLVLATQKPDATSIPTRLRDVIGTRFAGKVMTWQSSENVLGAGTYGAGYDASKFQRSHKGTGILIGADDSGAVEEASTVRTYLADGQDAVRVCARARALREAAGRLTGMAVGEVPMPPADRHEVLRDILGIWPLDEERMWSAEIVERLAGVDSRYEGWTADTLAATVKPLGLSTRQIQKTIDGERRNQRGLHRRDVVEILGEASTT